MSNIKLIADLNQYFLQHSSEIENWFKQKEQLATAIFYCSIDLRNDGTKIVPVDNNLFPGGFNNLPAAALDFGAEAVRKWFTAKNLSVKKILLIPENHTRNMPYYENVAFLCNILQRAECEVRIGSMLLTQDEKVRNLQLSRQEITLEALWRKGNVIGVADFVPEMIVLNNDLSDGIPEILQNLQQAIIPPFVAGWFNRTKSEYFKHYKEVSAEFASYFNLDSWQIASLFYYCEGIDFMQQDGMECIKEKTAALLQAVQDKYSEYKIASKPFVMVKADYGTYGMGVMNVDSVEQLEKLNHRQRTHMSTTKGGRYVNKVIIQEGVYTSEFLGEKQAPAEPVMYMLGAKVIGSFYRMNANRKNDQNLNSPGMEFTSLNSDNKFYYAYNVIALLSQLAAAKELESYVEESLLLKK